MKWIAYLRRADDLRAIFPIRDALALARSQKQSTAQRDIHLKPLGHSITLREGSSDLACFHAIFRQHEYASPYKMEPRLIVDAGANIGAASLYLTARYPDARIIAIEPDESNFELLVKNCASYPNIIPVQAALWFETTKLSFLDPDAEKWAMTVGNEKSGSTLVDAVTIPQLMKLYGFDHIDLLKIDIEGAELELFSNAPIWLDQVDYMVIELHDRFRTGCSTAFYSALQGRAFDQEIVGENLFIRLVRPTG